MIQFAGVAALSGFLSYFVVYQFLYRAPQLQEPKEVAADPRVVGAGEAPRDSRQNAPTVKMNSYNQLREQNACLPDLATIPAEVLERTPFKTKGALEAFLLANPAASVATYQAIGKAFTDSIPGCDRLSC
jgi:hypothetical protein